MKQMQLNVNQLVRSAVVLAVGLPVSLAIMANTPAEKDPSELQALKTSLELPCLKYAVTKNDSKAERAAKDAIDELVGDGVEYAEVCKWVLK